MIEEKSLKRKKEDQHLWIRWVKNRKARGIGFFGLRPFKLTTKRVVYLFSWKDLKSIYFLLSLSYSFLILWVASYVIKKLNVGGQGHASYKDSSILKKKRAKEALLTFFCLKWNLHQIWTSTHFNLSLTRKTLSHRKKQQHEKGTFFWNNSHSWEITFFFTNTLLL